MVSTDGTASEGVDGGIAVAGEGKGPGKGPGAKPKAKTGMRAFGGAGTGVAGGEDCEDCKLSEGPTSS